MTEPHYLEDILVLQAAVIVVVPVFRRLGLGSVLEGRWDGFSVFL